MGGLILVNAYFLKRGQAWRCMSIKLVYEKKRQVKEEVTHTHTHTTH